MNNHMENLKLIWITWENQRRSVEFAKDVGAKLFVLDYSGRLRYIKCLYKTFQIVFGNKPDVLFIQNPSMLLSVFSVCILKPLFSFFLIVDRHSNFLITKIKRNLIFELIFHLLSHLTIRLANITIVTNEQLGHVVRILGGNVLIIPDKIPDLSQYKHRENNNAICDSKKMLLISSFAGDEPIAEVLGAFNDKNMAEYKLFISGNSKKFDAKLKNKLSDNITLTGFLPDNDYVKLLFEVDAVMVLSIIEYTLLCGCYEALSAEKPLITSKSEVLEQLFSGAVHVNNDINSIKIGVKELFKNINTYKCNSRKMKSRLNIEWEENKRKLINEIEQKRIPRS